MLAGNKCQLHLKGPQCCELGMPDLHGHERFEPDVDLTACLT